LALPLQFLYVYSTDRHERAARRAQPARSSAIQEGSDGKQLGTGIGAARARSVVFLGLGLLTLAGGIAMFRKAKPLEEQG
jgi:hypothetical protein